MLVDVVVQFRRLGGKPGAQVASSDLADGVSGDDHRDEKRLRTLPGGERRVRAYHGASHRDGTKLHESLI
jgi:hypothetical protein